MESIMQSSKECYITGRADCLHRHHIFGGGRRAASEKWGLWIWLTAEYHNMSGHGIHYDHKLDTLVKQEAQRKFVERYGYGLWMQVIGKNYLEEEIS